LRQVSKVFPTTKFDRHERFHSRKFVQNATFVERRPKPTERNSNRRKFERKNEKFLKTIETNIFFTLRNELGVKRSFKINENRRSKANGSESKMGKSFFDRPTTRSQRFDVVSSIKYGNFNAQSENNSTENETKLRHE